MFGVRKVRIATEKNSSLQLQGIPEFVPNVLPIKRQRYVFILSSFTTVNSNVYQEKNDNIACYGRKL